MPESDILRVRVTLKGRPVGSHRFASDLVTVGRDPEADLFLDNPGVSRQHLKFEHTPAGWVLEDLGSANGTFLNEQAVKRSRVSDGDVVQVGKFALWLSFHEDRRSDRGGERQRADAFQGTTVLTTDQLAKVMSASRQDPAEETEGAPEVAPVAPPPPEPIPIESARRPVTTSRPSSAMTAVPSVRRILLVAGVTVGIVVGLMVGAAAVWSIFLR